MAYENLQVNHTWSVRENFSLPADSRTTERGMVTRAVATHRTMSTADGLSLLSIGVPASSRAMKAGGIIHYAHSCTAGSSAVVMYEVDPKGWVLFVSSACSL